MRTNEREELDKLIDNISRALDGQPFTHVMTALDMVVSQVLIAWRDDPAVLAEAAAKHTANVITILGELPRDEVAFTCGIDNIEKKVTH